MNRISNFLIVFFLFFNLSGLFAQNDLGLNNARSLALAGSGLTFSDHWACFHNQAALAFINKPSVGVFALNKYNIRELNSGAVALALPIKKAGTIGLAYHIFNNSSIYTKQKLSLGYALLLGKSFSAGLQFDFLFTHVENYTDNLSFCGEFGILYRLSKNWEIGVHMYNFTAADYKDYVDEQIPAVMNIGAAWHIGENTLLVAEVENNSISGLIIRGGIEYEISKKIAFQLGMRSNPWINSFGFSYKSKGLRINIALDYHQLLGISPGISFDKYFGEE